jgi:hypothetical protein
MPSYSASGSVSPPPLSKREIGNKIRLAVRANMHAR